MGRKRLGNSISSAAEEANGCGRNSRPTAGVCSEEVYARGRVCSTCILGSSSVGSEMRHREDKLNIE